MMHLGPKPTVPLDFSAARPLTGCRGKVCYGSRKLAMGAAQWVAKHVQTGHQAAYQCAHCSMWHLSRVGKKAEQR